MMTSLRLTLASNDLTRLAVVAAGLLLFCIANPAAADATHFDPTATAAPAADKIGRDGLVPAAADLPAKKGEFGGSSDRRPLPAMKLVAIGTGAALLNIDGEQIAVAEGEKITHGRARYRLAIKKDCAELIPLGDEANHTGNGTIAAGKIEILCLAADSETRRPALAPAGHATPAGYRNAPGDRVAPPPVGQTVADYRPRQDKSDAGSASASLLPAVVVPAAMITPPASLAVWQMSGHWVAEAGSTLQEAVSRWGEIAGIHPVFYGNYAYPIDAPFAFDGSYEEALKTLVSGFSTAEPKPLLDIWKHGDMYAVVITQGNLQ